MTMNNQDPLHGITLKMMLEELQQSMGWEGLSTKININCFKSNPSFKSSLTFLRRTPWAREKVENLYLKQKGLNRKPQTAAVKPSSDDPWSTAKRNLKGGA